jgi:DNA-binding FrmR family transcriptional regulator
MAASPGRNCLRQFLIAPGGLKRRSDFDLAVEQTTTMAQPIEDRQKLVNRIRRLAGQIDALERAVENDAGFTDVMRLLSAGRGAINSIMAEVVEDHIQDHLLGTDPKPSRRELEAAEELLDVLRSYIK